MLYVGRGQQNIAHIAYAQYRDLFAPKTSFLRAACAHLARIGLANSSTYVGLQLRRNSMPERDHQLSLKAKEGISLSELSGMDSPLAGRSKRGVQKAVDCARQMQAALCAAEPALRVNGTCRVPVFVTSSSYQALTLASSLLGADAHWTADESFGMHTGPKAGHLPALLEMAVLSASAAIIGTAGSSYALEAANMANTTAITRDDWQLYTVVDPRAHPSQGACDALPRRGRSLLLPPGSCKADGTLARPPADGSE